MKQNSIVIAYIADTSGGKRIFNKHNIPVYLKPGKPLRDWATDRETHLNTATMLFMLSLQ